jgi:hypothetical protein
MPQSLAALLLGLALVVPQSAGAQSNTRHAPGQPVPLYVAAVEGSVDLTRNGERDALTENAVLVPGDRLHADRGRLEVRDDAGHEIYVDEASIVDVLSETAIRLMAGSLRIAATANARDGFRIDAPNATVTLVAPGEYRLRVAAGLRTDETELHVREGHAELATDRGTVEVSRGQVSVARGTSAPDPPVMARDTRDDLDAWADTRAGAYGPSASSASLPPQIASYGAVLDQHGTWAEEPQYGAVWYPSVTADWRPYAYGTWDHAGYYGSVWVGLDPWAWPTHHYGRWGWNGAWYWVPGTVWGPAWVTWGVSAGYVGWCPLGWNNLPVFGFSVGYFGGGYGSYGHYDRGYYGHGWTVVPHDRFRPGVPVWRHSVDHRGWSAHERSAFVTQRVPPAYRDGAGRGGYPTGGRGGSGAHYAVPRYSGSTSGSPRRPGGTSLRPAPGAPQGFTSPRAGGPPLAGPSRQAYGSAQVYRGTEGNAPRYGPRSVPQAGTQWATPRSGTSSTAPSRTAPRTSGAYRAYQGPGRNASSSPGGYSSPRAPRSYSSSPVRSVPSFRSYGGGGGRTSSAAPPPSPSRGGAGRPSGAGGRTAAPRGGPGRR